MSSFRSKDAYLLAECNEPYSLDFFLSLIHQITDICEQEDHERVLVDLRKVSGTFSVMDRYEIGVEIANVWGSRIKVAIVSDPGGTNFMTENTAVNRGAKLKIFAEMEDALKWLGEEE